MGTLRGFVLYGQSHSYRTEVFVKANILIDQAGHARLADFGLLTIISDPRYLLSSSSHSHGGTVRWMSPERIAPEQFGFKNSRPTISSDCYALGMVIYETISGNFPFHKDRDASVSMKVMQGKRPSRGAKITKSLWEMLERCWAFAPSNRPSIEDVHRCVEMMSNFPEPLSPGADDAADEDGDNWDAATTSSGGDSLDFYATGDRVQLPQTHSLHDHHSRRTPPPSRRMSSPLYLVNMDSSLSRSGNKRTYTPDSPPPALDQNKRQRVTLDSSATDDRVQLPPIHSLRDPYADSGRASPPTGQMGGGMPYPAQPQYDYSSRSPSITPYVGPESMGTRGSPIRTQRRPPKYGPYPPYGVGGNIRDPSWTQGMNQSSITHTYPTNAGSTTPTHSPAFVEGMASNLMSPGFLYLPRYVEDPKIGLSNLDTSAPYTFTSNRPLPPSASTSSSSSSTMTSPLQLPFPKNPAPNDRPDFNFRHHSTNGAELTLHGGAAHISAAGNDERYRMTTQRRPTSGPDPQAFPIIPPLNNTETTSPDRENSKTGPYHYTSHNNNVSRRATNSRS